MTAKPVLKALDHLVITTANPTACLAFYEALGFTPKDVGGRYELLAPNFKINVHIQGRELQPHAQQVTPGSADLCFELDGDLQALYLNLARQGLPFVTELVARTGRRGAMTSCYLRDPDGNLVELCAYP